MMADAAMAPNTMRVAHLYLASRQSVRSTVAILAGGALTWFLLGLDMTPDEMRGLQVVAPLLMAIVLGMSIWGPFGEIEQIAGLPIWRMRALQVGGLFLIAAACVFAIELARPDASGTLLLRNLAGYTGMIWIGSRLAGPALAPIVAWVLPIAYVVTIWVIEGHRWWAWAKQSTEVESATVIALGLLIAGLILMLRTPDSDATGEGETA